MAETIVRKTADQVKGAPTTTFEDVTDLSFSVAANTDYFFRFAGSYTTSATTNGIRLAINGPATPTALRVGGSIPQTNASSSGGSQTAYNTAIFASTNGGGATALPFIVEGIFRNGANAGTLALRFASEVGDVSTVLADSYGTIEAVAVVAAAPPYDDNDDAFEDDSVLPWPWLLGAGLVLGNPPMRRRSLLGGGAAWLGHGWLRRLTNRPRR